MDAACKKVAANCQMVYLQPNNDIAAQLANFEAAIAQGVDGILVTIINDAAFDDVVQRAIDAGIPTIAVTPDDREGAAGNVRLASIGQSYETAGYALAQSMAEIYPADGPITELLSVSALGQNWAEARIKGVETYLGEYAASRGRHVTLERIASGRDLAQTDIRVQAHVQENPDLTRRCGLLAGGRLGIAARSWP